MQQLKQLKAELKLLKGRIKTLPLDNTMMGLFSNELIPIFESYIDATIVEFRDQAERLTEQEDVVNELIDNTESSIHEELSMLIMSTFEKGAQLTALLEEALPELANELLAKKLRAQSEQFQIALVMASEAVEAATIPSNDEDEEEDDEDADDDGSDGASGDDGEDAPEEAAVEAETEG
jgi:hypothetical protein